MRSSTSKSIKKEIIFSVGLAMIILALILLCITLPKYFAKEDYNEEYTKQKDADETVYWYDYCNVDFDSLQKTNDQVVAWLYFENDDISYPIAQASDNDKYLHTNIEEKEAFAGSIFLDYKNTSDLNDTHSIIYGHNMRNLTMFGKLKYYRTQEGYTDAHLMFQIITPTYKYRYQVFSVETVSENSKEYATYTSSDSDFKALVKEMQQNSDQDIALDQSADLDHIVTLSTCTSDKANRYVIHGARIDTWDYASRVE